MTRVQEVEVRLPSWKWRFAVSVLIAIVTMAVVFAYSTVQGPLESSAAVQQLEDNVAGYATARTWTASDITGAIKWIAGAALACVWVPYAIGIGRYLAAQDD